MKEAKRRRKIKGYEELENNVSSNIEVIDSNFELDINELEKSEDLRPILIAGEAGVGKSHIISKILDKVKDDKNIDNVTFINCKDFVNSINDQKEDFYKVFITKVRQKVKGKKNIDSEYNNRFFTLINFFSLNEFFLATSIVAFLTSNLLNFNSLIKDEEKWNICTFLTIFFILIILFILNSFFWIRKICNKDNFNKFIIDSKRKEIIIFDEINRLIVPKGRSLQDIEKKFIKEISSLTQKETIFVFVASNKIIDNPDESEIDFIFKNFSKIYKIEKKEEIFKKIIYNIKNTTDEDENIKDEIFLWVKCFLNVINYRDLKLLIEEIDKLLPEFNKNIFDYKSFIFINVIKYFDYKSQEIIWVNNLLRKENSFLDKNSLCLLGIFFYDPYYLLINSWTEIEISWDDYNKNFVKNSIFNEDNYLKELMIEFEKTNNSEIKDKIQKIYSFYNKVEKDDFFKNWPSNLNFIIELDEIKNPINNLFTISKGYSHKIYYDFKKTLIYINKKTLNWISMNENDKFWLKFKIFYLLISNISNKIDFNSAWETIINFCNKEKNQNIYEYAFSIYFKILYLQIDLSDNTKNMYLFINPLNEKFQNFSFDNLNWKLMYRNLNDKEKEKILKQMLSYNIDCNQLKKFLIENLNERNKSLIEHNFNEKIQYNNREIYEKELVNIYEKFIHNFFKTLK